MAGVLGRRRERFSAEALAVELNGTMSARSRVGLEEDTLVKGGKEVNGSSRTAGGIA
jgi:hypothetical protein